MVYRAVGKRCAAVISELRLGMPDVAALDVLRELGFRTEPFDPIAIARYWIGKARYRRGARVGEAPGTVDCSSFVKWVYGECGLDLPRRTIQQVMVGKRVSNGRYRAGDLVFTAGRRSWYDDDPETGARIRVGHVGIVTGDRSVVHAMNSGRGVVEDPFEEFFARSPFAAACRLVGRIEEAKVLTVPESQDVESSDDLRWIVLREAVRYGR